jgi:hypothetical protein
MDYRIYDCNLQLKQSRYLMVDLSIPNLQRDPDVGRVTVTGGRPAVEGTDFTREDVVNALTGGVEEVSRRPEPAVAENRETPLDGGTGATGTKAPPAPP